MVAMTDEEARVSRIFKALCDENRVRVLRLLGGGEGCACRLLEELEVGQPPLSHHMRILCESGLVRCRREGKWMHYSLSPEGFSRAMACLRELSGE